MAKRNETKRVDDATEDRRPRHGTMLRGGAHQSSITYSIMVIVDLEILSRLSPREFLTHVRKPWPVCSWLDWQPRAMMLFRRVGAPGLDSCVIFKRKLAFLWLASKDGRVKLWVEAVPLLLVRVASRELVFVQPHILKWCQLGYEGRHIEER